MKPRPPKSSGGCNKIFSALHFFFLPQTNIGKKGRLSGWLPTRKGLGITSVLHLGKKPLWLQNPSVPHPDRARATCTNQKGVSQAAFFPQSLEPLLGTHPHRYYGSVRHTDSSLLSPCTILAHHDVIVFAEYTHLQNSAQSGGEEGGDVRFCYLYFCGVLLTQASRPVAEGARATGNVHPDTNG